MVRILTCHHFGGQKIGRCEEALQLAVADDLIIVALEHQVAVYSSELSSSSSDGHSEHSKLTQGATRDGGDIGSSPIFFMKKPGGGGGKRKARASSKGGSELVLSHSFPTVDLIDSISYNGRGNYLLCLEKRESSDGKKLSRSVRVYFNWDTSKEGKPMRARIAGLVSPTGADPDDDTLVMVEIPTTSPTGSSPPPNIVGAASCNILGHLATLTDTNVVNIYAYKLKEVKGRASKSQYSDFDLSYAVEVTNFSPDSARIEFLADIIAVSNEATVHVFRLTKQARTRSRTASNDSGGSFTSSGRRSVLSGASSIAGNTVSGPASLPNPSSHKTEQVFDKVVFDPKNESVKVHMNLITRANQKNRFPDAGTGIHEVYQEMISSKSKLIFSANAPALSIEDLLRIGIGHDSSPSIVQVGLYPVKIKDDLGGISCIVGMSSQALVYHVPAKLDSNVVRVVTYPLTAPLVSFAFDSLFFHALTETGLETYTSRSLYYPLKEFEGFQRHHNECPFIDETPSLVGIRPFMGVRYMAANEFLLCLLASPSITHSTSASPSFVEDSLWTIYALQLPSIQLLCEDLSKASQAAKAGNLDTFVTLATELHLVLRTHVNMYPESEPHFRKEYQKTCKAIGMEYWKKATIRYDEAIQLSEGTDKYRLETQAEDALDKGVTFLTMAGVDIKHIFEEEPNLYLKDRSIVRGVTRFVSVALRNAEGQPVSPKLTATVTDFLLTQSPETLVDLATEVPLLRETNSAKLIQIIRKLAESSGYKRAECVALLLTIVTAGGCESGTRSSVKEVLQKCKAKDNLDSSFKLQWLMDFKVVSKPKLTDLAICLSTARPSLPAAVISQHLEKSKVSIGQVLMAFSQGINLSSDVDVQNSLTQTMTTILEKYFTEKLKAASNRQAIYNNLANQVNYENGLVSVKAALKPLDVATVDLTDDETHAVNTLARSYVSRIALKPATATQPQRHNSGETNAHTSISPAQATKEPSEATKKAAEAPKTTLTEAKVTPFGKLPNFIVHIIKETHTFVNSNATSFQVTALLPGVTEETKEFFMKLGSLLTSPLGNAAGVKDVVLNFLETKGQPGAPLHVCLEILAASYDKAVQALIAKFPFALMYYAKDTFGRSTVKWKFLVTKLKEKIYDNKEDVEIFATIIESVYLHVANTLAPSELEEVLDKGEENSRFFTACRRTELANSYNQMIVQMSNEYL